MSISSLRLWRPSSAAAAGATGQEAAEQRGAGRITASEHGGASTRFQALPSASASACLPGQDVHFRVTCSKGTYVRSLAHDIGRALGTVSYLWELRRERVGPFLVSDAWQVPEIVGRLQDMHAEQKAAGEDS